MALREKERSHRDYKIAWVCAIEPELVAARAVLDDEHPKLPAVEGDRNSYVFGRIGSHNVVIASLPSGTYGTNAAAVAATDVRRSFKALRFALMVGVGGGVPKITDDPDTSIDIRLGDVVVGHPAGTSTGVIQYDLGKTVEGSIWPQRTGSLNRPPLEILNAIATLRSQHTLHQQSISYLLATTLDKHSFLIPDYVYQGSDNDILYARYCIRSEGAGTRHKDKRKLEAVPRPPRNHSNPVIHYGTIASGNQVVKDSVTRDYWRDTESVLCFEMEAAGMMLAAPCLIIRGICDYTDSHKNKQWQPYAALAASSYAKELLLEMPTEDESRSQDPSINDPLNYPRVNLHYTVPFSSKSFFTGREDVMQQLRFAFSNLAPRETSPTYQQRFVITGSGGVGKSEVAIKFAETCREEFWGIFWIDAGNHSNSQHSVGGSDSVPTAGALEGFRIIGELCSTQSHDFDAVKRWLANTTHRWLLIIDNADDPNIDYAQYFPSGNRGNIILTSRNPECQSHQTVGGVTLGNLDEELASDLLLVSCGISESLQNDNRRAAVDVVSVLGCHTLALVQAGAFIKGKRCNIKDYVAVFKRKKEELLKFKSIQMKSTHGSIYATFEVSASYLCRLQGEAAGDALGLLDILAFMHHTDVSEIIFRTASEKIAPSRNLPKTKDIACFPNCLDQFLPRWMCSSNSQFFDNFRWRQACSLLETLAILNVEEKNNKLILSMHPLIHDWLICRQNSSQRALSWRSTASILALATFEPTNQIGLTFRLSSHIYMCISQSFENYFDNTSLVSMEQVLLHFANATIWHKSSTAERLYQYLVHDRIEGAYSAQNNGTIQWEYYIYSLEKSQPEEYLKLLEAIVAQEKQQDIHACAQSGLIAILLSNYMSSGRATEALDLFRKLLREHRCVRLNMSCNCSDLVLKLAEVYVALEQPEVAESILEAELAMCKVFAKQKNDTENAGNEFEWRMFHLQAELGHLFLSETKKYKNAVLACEQALMWEQELGEGFNTPVLTIFTNKFYLASAYLLTGQYRLAAELYKRILSDCSAISDVLTQEMRANIENFLQCALTRLALESTSDAGGSKTTTKEDKDFEEWCLLRKGIGRRRSTGNMSNTSKRWYVKEKKRNSLDKKREFDQLVLVKPNIT